MAEHTERVTITDALAWDCVEGECEHYDEDEADMGMWEHCPKITIEVCVDCMEERGHGREERFWEELVSHTDPPEPGPPTSLPEPSLFKPAAEGAGQPTNREDGSAEQ